jgi:hypothetical protein
VTRVVICGSVANPDLVAAAVAAEQAVGRTVIARPSTDDGMSESAAAAARRRHIERCDEVVVVAKPDGTLGAATAGERAYPEQLGRTVRTELQRRAQRRYHLAAHRRRACGDADRVDAAPARAHIARLRSRGWTWPQVAAAAQMRVPVVQRIAGGGQQVLRKDRARRFLTLEPVWQPTRLLVPWTGTGRRLEALAWQGWSLRRIEAELGLCGYTLYRARQKGRLWAATAAAVAAFYDARAAVPGPNRQVATWARRQAAVRAWCWDPDDIDDPAARPGVEPENDAL